MAKTHLGVNALLHSPMIYFGIRNASTATRGSATTDAMEVTVVSDFKAPVVVRLMRDLNIQKKFEFTCTANSEPAATAKPMASGETLIVASIGAMMPAAAARVYLTDANSLAKRFQLFFENSVGLGEVTRHLPVRWCRHQKRVQTDCVSSQIPH